MYSDFKNIWRVNHICLIRDDTEQTQPSSLEVSHCNATQTDLWLRKCSWRSVRGMNSLNPHAFVQPTSASGQIPYLTWPSRQSTGIHCVHTVELTSFFKIGCVLMKLQVKCLFLGQHYRSKSKCMISLHAQTKRLTNDTVFVWLLHGWPTCGSGGLIKPILLK